MPFAIGVTGTRIHYDEVGTTGPHVVLVQGLPRHHPRQPRHRQERQTTRPLHDVEDGRRRRRFRLGEITCPTVVVSGTEDVLIPSKNSRILAKRIRGVKLELLEGVGHAIPAMDARVVARSLHDVRKMVGGP